MSKPRSKLHRKLPCDAVRECWRVFSDRLKRVCRSTDQPPHESRLADWLGITPDELEKLRKAAKPGRRHPVAALVLSDPPSREAVNTEQAGRQISATNADWLASQRSRLLDTSDFSQSSSALGEIRAYGALLEAGFRVDPRPRVGAKVPDFEVDAGDGPVIVEVHSKQLDKAGKDAMKQAEADAEAEARAGGRVGMGEAQVAPFGVPDPGKKGDSVTTNAISRIASIKGDEDQVDPNKPFVLWLDWQDMTAGGLPMTVSEEHFSPLYTEDKDGEVGSGVIWFALYGRRGDPMIEMRGYDYSSTAMLHDGRFYQTINSHGGPTRVSAYVFSLPGVTVLMEHPDPARPLPPRFRATILRTPHFRLDLSLCEWEPHLMQTIIDTQRKAIAAAARALEAHNPV